MDPGRELDVLISEFVIGSRKALIESTDYAEYERIRKRMERCPKYSTDIAAAWKIVEKFKFSVIYTKSRWRVCRDFEDGECEDWLSSAKTAPHAICLAVLKAVGA